MNVRDFMLNAQTGLINPPKSRPISNQGSISDIRKRTAAMLRPAGSATYGMLGSQNAMTSEVQEYTIDLDIDITDPNPPRPEIPGAPPPILPGRSRNLLGGGTQSEASKKAAEKRAEEEAAASATEPSDRPPYDLSSAQGKAAFQAYSDFVIKRYGKQVGQLRADDIKKDSDGFTVALKAWRQINKEISAFNKDDKRRWTEWASNTFVKFADKIIDAIALGATAAAPESALAIEAIKNLAKKFKPTDEKDFVKSMKELQAKLFDGKPEWKRKLNEMSKIAWDDLMKKWKDFPAISEQTGGAGTGRGPIGGL